MAETRDIVIIGAGHNGLVTAFYLAKAGLKPLVLERRPQVGGCAITSEFHLGFRCSTLAHSTATISRCIPIAAAPSRKSRSTRRERLLGMRSFRLRWRTSPPCSISYWA